MYKIVWKFRRGGGLFKWSKNGTSKEERGAYVKFPPWWGCGYFLELHILQ